MEKLFVALLFISLSFSTAHGQLRFKDVAYESDGESMRGLLVTTGPEAPSGPPKPTVIMLHDRMGLSPFIKRKAEEVAQMGYTVFIADLYGKDKQPKDTDQAIAISRKLKDGARAQLRARNLATYKKLKEISAVDTNRISVIGYCFGGTAALEMGRQGLKLDSIISVHGNLNTTKPKDAGKIKSKLLILHGAVDPIVPPKEVDAFFNEMNQANVDYQFISYANAVHAFTKKEAGSDPARGAAYNETADKRATKAVRSFLQEVYP